MTKKQKVINKIIEMYPDAKCELNYETPYQLLIATMLSAQSTDVRVNIVTKQLFKDYGTMEDIDNMEIGELKEFIRSIGFFNSKGENIKKTTSILIEKYDSKVPKEIEVLTTLPGVGRKTANVVVSNAFGVPAFAVDTHVKRIAYRLGLTDNTDPDKVEMDITKYIPKKLYIQAHHAMIFHGRYRCKAIKPNCVDCDLQIYCRYYKNKE